MDDKLIEALKKICSSEDAAALVTIIKVQGSTPRKAGAKMMVTGDGQTFGTIGGGCGEADVRREALMALDVVQPRRYVVNMTQDMAEEEGMVCGGVMDVLIDVLPAGQNREKEFMQQYLTALQSNGEPLLLTVLDTAKADLLLCCKAFVTSDGEVTSSCGGNQCVSQLHSWSEKYKDADHTALVDEGHFELFVEPTPKRVELIILGGGHIALPLHDIAKVLGYHITVIDDRPSFAHQQRFPYANQVICDDFLTAIKDLSLTMNSFIVIVTRGHRHDKNCLKAVIEKPVGYIGMIGSKRRVKALMAEMIAEGIAEDAVAKVHSPIGMDIGAQTPAEIAVSILAEVINVHRRKGEA